MTGAVKLYSSEIRSPRAWEAMNAYARRHEITQEPDGSFALGGVCVGYEHNDDGGWCTPKPSIEIIGHERRAVELVTKDIERHVKSKASKIYRSVNR